MYTQVCKRTRDRWRNKAKKAKKENDESNVSHVEVSNYQPETFNSVNHLIFPIVLENNEIPSINFSLNEGHDFFCGTLPNSSTGSDDRSHMGERSNEDSIEQIADNLSSSENQSGSNESEVNLTHEDESQDESNQHFNIDKMHGTTISLISSHCIGCLANDRNIYSNKKSHTSKSR